MTKNKEIYPLKYWFRNRVRDSIKEQIIRNELFTLRFMLDQASDYNKKSLNKDKK